MTQNASNPSNQDRTDLDRTDLARLLKESALATPQGLQGSEVLSGDEARMRPDVMSFLVQAASAAQLARLRRLEESKIPTGSKGYSRTIGFAVTRFELPRPCISFNVINDGPNNVGVAINNQDALMYAHFVLPTESYGVDLRYPIIYRLFFQTAVAGATAAIRLSVIEGKTPIEQGDATAIPGQEGWRR